VAFTEPNLMVEAAPTMTERLREMTWVPIMLRRKMSCEAPSEPM